MLLKEGILILRAGTPLFYSLLFLLSVFFFYFWVHFKLTFVNRWVIEKYDGVRALWNHKRRAFYTRWGSDIFIPNYIVDSMTPHFWIDSEISFFSYYSFSLFLCAIVY